MLLRLSLWIAIMLMMLSQPSLGKDSSPAKRRGMGVPAESRQVRLRMLWMHPVPVMMTACVTSGWTSCMI